MRVLHLFGNHKWTGPAEPALNLCLALKTRGVEADFACAKGPAKSVNKVVETARDRGVQPLTHLHLQKHRHPIRNAFAARALGRLLTERHYDIVHCHLDNDHRVAIASARKRGVPVVRSNYGGTGMEQPRLLSGTRFVVQPSTLALEHDAGRGGFPREGMRVIPGGVDVERFDPAREVPDGRRWLGIPREAFVIGIVARMQKHRHFEDLWEAVRMLVRDNDQIHVLVIGRGTNQETVGMQPVRALGLVDHVHFPGFIEGENFVGMLHAVNVKVFLAPGSDGTCRAVREAMAMGKPAVVSDRGMLPEIVDHESTGYVTDGSPEQLHRVLLGLSRDRRLTRALGAAAREKALAVFSLEAQSKAVLDVYRSIL